MADVTQDSNAEVRDSVVELVSAYVSNSNTRLSAEEFQDMIRATFTTLSNLAVNTVPQFEAAPISVAKTKAEVRKSITADGLVSFIDGKSYKTLRRHLTTKGYTPESYRDAFGLPADYPLVAASYSAARSQMAKDIGLGAKGRRTASPAVKTRKASTNRASAAE